MYAILLLSITIGLSVGAPFSSFDLKRPTDTSAVDKVIPETTSKLLTIVKKNLKPNKEQPTVLVSEELVIASTGYPTFDAFDQNSDGFVDFEEFAATDGKDHKRNFQRADTNGDHKLSPEEFSQLSLVVYEPEEEFSDSDGEEPPMVFLTPPESITRFNDKEVKSDSETAFDDYKDVPEFDSTAKEETKEDKEVNDEKKETKSDDKIKTSEDNKSLVSSESEKKSDKPESSAAKVSEDKDKDKEGSHFTAEDMPVRIDEDDEEMIDVKDEDIPMEVIDDLNDDNHYDLNDDVKPQEDDKQMNDQLNSVE